MFLFEILTGTRPYKTNRSNTFAIIRCTRVPALAFSLRMGLSSAGAAAWGTPDADCESQTSSGRSFDQIATMDATLGIS